MRPLNIMIANNIYPPIMAGGAELIVSYLAEGLVARGHRVRVISTCSLAMEPYPVEIRAGVEVIRFFPKNMYWHWERGNRPSYQKALWHIRDAWNTDAAAHVQKLFAEDAPDILNTHLLDGFSAAIWKAAAQRGAKIIHTAHDYHLICPRSVMLTKSQKICTTPSLGCKTYRSWHIGTTKYVDSFCSPSQFLINKHIEAGLKARRTTLLPNGIPLPVVTQRLPKRGGEPIIFLFAARHTVEKGCVVLRDAIRAMPRDINCQFLIAGKGPLEQIFLEESRNDPRIKLLGYIQGDEKDKIFREADCLLLPSLWYENAPVVIVEAAAYGIGVIGSDLGAIPEFITHEKNGLLCKAGDAQSLKDAMLRIVQEPDLRQNLACGGKDLLARSSVDHMVGAYEQEYRAILERS